VARLRARIKVTDASGNNVDGAVLKLYEPGTAVVTGLATSGTPFASPIYAGPAGGVNLGHVHATDNNGEVVIWTPSPTRYDVGIEYSGSARVSRYEAFEFDPSDVLTAAPGAQSVLQTGTLAAPSLAQAGNLNTGFNVDSDGNPSVVKDGIGLLEAFATSTVLRSPNGEHEAILTDAGVFTAPGLLRFFGYVNVRDHNVLASGGSGQASTNTSILNALFESEAASRRYFFPAGDYPIGAGLNVNHNQGAGASKSISLVGVAGQSSLTCYGTAGPWISFGTNADSPLYGGGIEDLLVFHGETPASGATVAVGNIVAGPGIFAFNNMRIKAGSASNASFIGIQNGIGAFGGGFHMENGKIDLRADSLVTAVGVLIANSAPTSAISIRNVGIDGEMGHSHGIRLQNTGEIDTINLREVSIKDHSLCFYMPGTCTAPVTNVFLTDVILDGCQDYNILVQPGVGGSLGNVNVQGIWMSSEERCVQLDETNGGTVGSWRFIGGDSHNATLGIFGLGAGVSNIKLIGMELGSNISAAGEWGVDACGAAGAGVAIDVIGCTISVLAGAAGALRMSTAVEPFVVANNTYRGVDASVPADNGTSKRNSGNAFLA
jgi:hypothetical protein